MAELVDALGSGSSEGFLVRVRISPSAPLNKQASVIVEAFLFASSALRSNPSVTHIPYTYSADGGLSNVTNRKVPKLLYS